MASRRRFLAAAAAAGLSGAVSPAAAANGDPLDAVRFLSDEDDAYKYLERLQALAYADDPQAFRWTGDAEQLNRLRDLLRELDQRGAHPDFASSSFEPHLEGLLEALRRPVATRHEDPISIAIADSVRSALEAEIRRTHSQFEAPYVGTLPGGGLTARTIAAPPGAQARLIVVNSEFFSFVHELVKIALCTITIDVEGEHLVIDPSQEQFERRSRYDHDLRVRLSMALEDFANDRRVHGQAPPRAYDDPFVRAMVHAIELFVIGHEYAHIVLDHVPSATALVRLRGGIVSVAEAQREWGQEAAADIFSQSVLHRMSDGCAEGVDCFDPLLRGFVRCAPMVYAKLYRVAEEARLVIANGVAPERLSDREQEQTIAFLQRALDRQSGAARPEPATDEDLPGPDKSHPPMWAREAMLASHWASETPPDAWSNMAMAMARNLTAMWGDLAPIWIEIIERNE